MKTAFDRNIFLVSGDGSPEPESWVTTLSPRIALNLKRIVDRPELDALSLTYAPERNDYHQVATENFTAHRLSVAIKAASGPTFFSFDHAVLYVDGSTASPVYSVALHDDQRSAYATAVPRERREQWQNRTKLTVQWNRAAWFVRGSLHWLDYDLRTDLRPTPGYQNYCDRSDLNGGFDFARRLRPDLFLTLGYRRGHQTQQLFPTEIDRSQSSSPSSYDRVLVGIEGKAARWLSLSILTGPDFRSYPASSPSHTSLVPHSHPTRSYFEASVIATPTARDTVTFKGKRWYWVSSTGKVPLVDSAWELAYRRKVDSRSSLEASVKRCASDYSCGIGSAALRNDVLDSFNLGFTYAVTARFSVTATASVERGRNAQGDLETRLPTRASYREFDREVIALGAAWKF